MVINRNKNDLDYSKFLNPILIHFAFLVSDYGFQMGVPRSSGREFIIDFVKPAVGVLITCEIQSLPVLSVYLTSGENILYHPLSSISKVQLKHHYAHIQHNFTTEDAYACAFDLCLKVHADLLRQYGEKFLRGDPSDLHGVRPGQYNVTRRKK